MGAAGQVLYSLSAAAGASITPSSVLDTIAYLGYSVPTIGALFAFPKPPALLISRFRGILDAVVITVGIFFVSEVTVLRPVREASELQGVAAWSGLAYPLADLAICSLVFTLGMRQAPTTRPVWLCLGSGLVILAVTDSIYVRLLADGQTDLTGTPLTVGWVVAPVLIGLAALLPTRRSVSRARDLTLVAQLIPYVPVWAAVVALGLVSVKEDPFLLVAGILLLIAVTVRQVMIIYENVSLTRDLEAKVHARTAELGTLGSIVTSSSDAVVGIDMDGRITAWNPAAEDLYGYRANEVLGRRADFLPDAIGPLSQLLQRASRREPLLIYEADWARPDGRVVPVALRISPIQTGDIVEGISVFGQDISGRKRAAAALERAREEALEASRLKSEFLATVSHEVRTPMNGVIGLTSLLLETGLNDNQRQFAQGILDAGEALLSVLNDILDFSKLEAGKVVLDPGEFDPRRLVKDVGLLLAPAASAKNLELVAYCTPDVPSAVVGDAGRIRQILLNLTSNAVKFTSAGEVVAKVKPIDLGQSDVRLRFEVSDTGIGIANDDRDRLFDPFSQADASTTRRFGGTGLGLAISRRLVEVMGGEIGVMSELGVGSTFWFEIPLPVNRADKAPIHVPDGHCLAGLRVLVVDDNATNRKIVETQLTAWGMRPKAKRDATSALEVLRSQASRGEPYDVVVLDMSMPDVDGLQLARAISGAPELRRTKMIMLTSSLQLEPAVLRGAGISQWLSKPVRSSELYDKLIRLVAPEGLENKRAGEPELEVQEPRDLLGRILVVEDNAINQTVAEGLLTRLGYAVDSVSNGMEAVEAFHSTSYAAILMDCHMPVLDGFAATRQIRRQETPGQRIPIIAMTAGALSEDRERCLEAGMDDYVSKPVNAQTLTGVLSSWLKYSPSTALDGQVLTSPEDGESRKPIDEDQIAELRELACSSDASLFSVVLDKFVQHSGGQFVALRQAVQRGDVSRIEEIAHELRGVSGTVGASQVVVLCREIEWEARRGRVASRPGLLEELDAELQRARQALARMVLPVP